MSRDLAEAAAIRSAAELREHVDGVRPIDGVLLWENDCVRCFPVDWPEDEGHVDDSYSRFNLMWSALDDFQTITKDEAREMAKYDTCLNLNRSNHKLDLTYMDSCPAESVSVGPMQGPKLLATHIEF